MLLAVGDAINFSFVNHQGHQYSSIQSVGLRHNRWMWEKILTTRKRLTRLNARRKELGDTNHIVIIVYKRKKSFGNYGVSSLTFLSSIR
jgi:uncharacterized protein YebE (UPF0316 family)